MNFHLYQSLASSAAGVPRHPQRARTDGHASVPASLLCMILLLFGAAPGRADEGVRISGLFTRLTFDGKGKVRPARSSTNTFRVLIARDGRYAMEVDSLGETDSVHLTFDGFDSYCVRYSSVEFEIKKGRPQKTAVKPITEHYNQAYISSGRFPYAPFDELKRAHTLWLVYGSGNYIQNLKTNTMPLPWMLARTDMLSYGFRLEHELSAVPPFFPRHLRFIRDSKLDLPEDAEAGRLEVDAGGQPLVAYLANGVRERKNEYKDGFVRGEVEVMQVTSRNGMELPISFSIKGYDPGMKGVFWEVTGRATNLTDVVSGELAKEFFLPSILGPINVQDARFRDQGASRKLNKINYALRMGDKWPPKDAPRLQRIYASSLKALRFSAPVQPTLMRAKRRTIAFIFLSATLVAPLFFYVISRRKKRMMKLILPR